MNEYEMKLKKMIEAEKKNQQSRISWMKQYTLIHMVLVTIIALNNIVSMGLFMYDDYLGDKESLILDSIVTTIFVFEFFYNFWD